MVMNLYSAFSIHIFKCALQARDLWVRSDISIYNAEKAHLEFLGAFFLAENFEKVSFYPYNFRTTRLSARKSEQMKNF